MTGESILVVEDDETLALVLTDNLAEAGYQVTTVHNGADARTQLDCKPFELLMLDIMLPDTDGYTLCREARDNNLQSMILMLTARSLEDDIVKGFEAGADDYLTKPYRLRELLLRVKALLRRNSSSNNNELAFDRFRMDAEARCLYDESNNEIELTKKEFDLLEYLLQSRNRALTRTQILDRVWGEHVVVEERTVDNFVSNLKKKLGWHQDAAYRIVSIRGIGYRMEVGV